MQLKSTKIDLTAVLPLLPENKAASLTSVVASLEAAVASGKVKNKQFADIKFIINRRVEDVVEAFDKANGYRQYDTLVMGAYNVPAALKEMMKKNNAPRAAVLKALLPLNELMQAAKPLIVKRVPGEKTEKQIAEAKAREGKAMTCQCCGRDIFAETGKIAHHGYERPGDGFQTASCMGALYAPFESSRTRLGAMITGLTRNRDDRIEQRGRVEREEQDIVVAWTNYSKPRFGRLSGYEEERTYVSRLVFAELAAGELSQQFSRRGITSFDVLKKNEIAEIDARIEHLNERIAYEQARYDGWKETHRWQAGRWVTVDTTT